MRLSSKISLRFLVYFVVFYAVLFLVTFGMFAYIIFDLLSKEAISDIRALEAFEIESDIAKQPDGSYVFSEDFIKLAKQNSGHLYLVDQAGEVLATTEQEILSIEWVAIQKQDHAVWELTDQLFLLFIENQPVDLLLGKLYINNKIQMNDELEKEFSSVDAAVEIYNQDGIREEILYGDVYKALSSMEIVTNSQDYFERKEITGFQTMENGKVLVVRMPNTNYHPFEPALIDTMKKLVFSILAFHLFLFIFTILFSIWIGYRFGRPLLYFLHRIEKLSVKDYDPPNDKRLRSPKSGRFKRKYRIYEEVDKSLARLANTLKSNEEKIIKTEKLREDWITGLSHDLKTPLSSIYGYSIMLSSNEYTWTPIEVQRFAKTMQEKSIYMNALIEDLTYTYQLKNDAIQLNKEKLNLFDFLRSYVYACDWNDIQEPIGNKDITVYLDAKLFERVLDNLVGNAVKHTPKGTKVHLEIYEKDSSACLVIRDEGPGIPKVALDNLFNRYYRGTNTTSEISGTGLGLAISKQLIEAHNGTILVESSKIGTLVTVTFPKE
ncbi:ATP-binding protein [Psychrobacillus sp. FSL K6-2684]|uniref:sensor histidine kinase n=1 Tax=Psychrobacillus sp. FSL K6-2684 TaxID=2921547 RepID=UPI0030F76F0F